MIALVGTILLSTVVSWNSTHGKELRRVGFLSPGPQTFQLPFFQGLKDLGYVEARNISILRAVGEGRDSDLPHLTQGLLDRRVEIIVATNSAAVRVASQKTAHIPIVMVTSVDPIGDGFIESFRRPGKNITGLSSADPGFEEKIIELLGEVANPRRIALFWNPEHPVHPALRRRVEQAAAARGLAVETMEVGTLDALGSVIKRAPPSSVEAGILLPDHLTLRHREAFVTWAARYRLPVIYWTSEFVDAGGLMSFGVRYGDLYYRAASYVDRLLRGGRPHEIPVEQPASYELTINLRAARSISIAIPASLIVRANKIIPLE